MYKVLVASFVVTALYDVLLRLMVEGRVYAPEWLKRRAWFKSLIKYFQKQTLLAAALVAGFVGAITNFVILKLHPMPSTTATLFPFLLMTLVVSWLSGIAMRASKLFPILDSTMYEFLSTSQEIWADAASGVVVNFTLFLLRRVAVL